MPHRRFNISRWTIRLAIATWVVTVVWILVFAAFWRLNYMPPHAAWAAASIATIVGSTAAVILLGVWQIIRGPKRLVAIAVVILGTTPIVCLAIFFADLKYRYSHHAVNPTAPVRVAAFWLSSVLDLEARWRYPRWTYGRHVVLIDDGQTPESEQRVAQMDKHIDGMMSLLDKPLPSTCLRWVRGTLTGQGLLMLNWAMCGENRAAEPADIERHEIAHAAITAMCGPDHYPPTLLFEGWAESQSGDRASEIRSLAETLEKGRNYSLDEFIGPELYSLHISEDHDHGAPLVHFLIEHYGAEKFFSLYKEVRPATFAKDCKRVLGDPWPVVQKQFWSWLTKEAAPWREGAAKPHAAQPKPENQIELSDAVDKADWQAIVDGYVKSKSDRDAVPEHFAFSVEHDAKYPKGSAMEGKDTQWRWACVVDGRNAWFLDESQQIRFRVAHGNLVADLSLGTGERVHDDSTSANEILTDARRFWHNKIRSRDPLRYLLGTEETNRVRHTRIERIARPKPGTSLWELDVECQVDDDKWIENLVIDANANWQTRRSRVEFRDGSSSEAEFSWGSILGHSIVTTTIHDRSDKHEDILTQQICIRDLNDAEAQAVRDEVETTVRNLRRGTWKTWLVQPLTVAIAWPTTGFLLLGFARYRSIRMNGRQ